MKKKIAFYSRQLSIRGTEVALYNYAKYNEEILGNKSVIFSNPNSDLESLNKFKSRFEVNLLEFKDCEKFLKENNFDFLYTIKAGVNDGNYFEDIPTLVHAVFRHNDPHGYKYFYVSDWLCKDQGHPIETHSLPHICEKLPPPNYSLREKLNIKKTDIVFGCYGGRTEFNIQFVKDVIINISNNRNDIKFIFMNIDNFTNNPNVFFLNQSYDLFEKSAFINACDAMIHARFYGETFGLSISEFALENKPIITFSESSERSHIDILGERGIYYNTPSQLESIFLNLKNYIKHDDYTIPYQEFSPEKIMLKFNKLIS
jgi:hypothetical protein